MKPTLDELQLEARKVAESLALSCSALIAVAQAFGLSPRTAALFVHDAMDKGGNDYARRGDKGNWPNIEKRAKELFPGFDIELKAPKS